MNPAKPVMRAVDRYQQQHRVLAFPLAVWKKFGDDQAGSQAALIAYYAFVSIFPLLLVLTAILGIVLRHDQSLKTKIINDAVSDFPSLGNTLASSVNHPTGTGIALVVGLILTFFGARGVATAAQNAFNQVWEVPLNRRPSGVKAILRSFGMITVVGLGEIISLSLAGLAGGVGSVFTGVGAWIATTLVALLLNIGVFWVGMRLAIASEIHWREMWLGVVLSAVIWQILQSVGAYVLKHDVTTSNAAYGTFAVVLGLLAWLYLQAELTLYAVEANVVYARNLWPRSLFPPPYTAADRRAYELYAKVQERRPGQEVETRLPADPEPRRFGRKPKSSADSPR